MNTQLSELRRTEWKAKKLSDVWHSVQPLFQQLTSEEVEEITANVREDNVEYFEIAHYLDFADDDEEADPSAVLVFQGHRVFWDIIDLERKEQLIDLFRSLTRDSAKFVKERKLTKAEWKRRFEAILCTEHENEDRESIVDRSAFILRAKEPALNWLVALENKNEPVAPMKKFEWTLDIINSEPTVFLAPAEIELWPLDDQAKEWRRLKINAFIEFLWSYCTDDEEWPEALTEELFDQWFDIVPLGVVVDLTQG